MKFTELKSKAIEAQNLLFAQIKEKNPEYVGSIESDRKHVTYFLGACSNTFELVNILEQNGYCREEAWGYIMGLLIEEEPKKCSVCSRKMGEDECGDEFPEERVCDKCAGV